MKNLSGDGLSVRPFREDSDSFQFSEDSLPNSVFMFRLSVHNRAWIVVSKVNDVSGLEAAMRNAH